MDFPTLLLIVVAVLILLKLLRASAKILVSATVIAGIAYFVMYVLPNLG